ncbi:MULTISPECIES: hypothetical protein [Bradyrhizobium]|uniref:Uncharacterized protein n=1 Tax=Bradyrhizobium brasilense TaxID=1419277 RepID=A0ABY8JJI6_9BRAD|nr:MULTISPECIES: hypothetical protein [Bradyrhizobium]KRQ12198.1 hypothetical protein AOQ73_04675 [Bradyrhizobium pachyrhizi]MCP1830141.1 hypothetical protein [Bradyrhizobium sp. USDA 4545]MCP1923250.1 hypothetical protein [Bradyrhizobium sp. USDA 4532]OMI05918.1 hypothetical protein BSN85_23575 [Bradyrhizobium brasilense]WFU65273.1 hypothetical protein QA636_06970 [Bradyrhizobium brasilense]
MDRQAEVEHLAQSDRHIATAEQHITKQRLLLDNLRAEGHDTKVAEEMLTGFEHNLKTLREHRAIIVKTIEQIDEGLA